VDSGAAGSGDVDRRFLKHHFNYPRKRPSDASECGPVPRASDQKYLTSGLAAAVCGVRGSVGPLVERREWVRYHPDIRRHEEDDVPNLSRWGAPLACSFKGP